ncbi:Gfo/Idh/MocA family oxidoreductase [Actinomadura sp. HBU206391]|uniref:Gfo/Idh/MocA family oxidoreductase n=1 Tax=Actinomadura sp. HBU206391 TaxID=2731692 RepID=UPI0016501B09|nr:Gfo/Idh/MocA family oxidoreductase [Actinomadura sp. HBU206391]MBC6458252.1 Gfo/Idh/MocA family oxidoreductase [Actinomadura sp. HBU206391]
MSLRVALIGYGTGGAVFHAPLISSVPGLTLSAVVTSDPVRQEAVRRRHPGAAVLDGADRVWDAASSYDLVVVTTPNRLHVPLASAALEAGLPVVVDKPVAATAGEARSLGALAAERGLLVVPFHNRRWDGDFRTVRGLIAEGRLGDVRRLESRFERWRPEIKPGWKENADPAVAGGVLYDLGSHLIDQAVTLLGRPLRVYAELNTRRAGAVVPDDAFVALTHPGGRISHLWMSAVTPLLGPRFRVLGGDAGHVAYGLDGQEDALRAGRTPLDEGWGISPPESYGVVGTPEHSVPVPTEPGAYQEFYADVARAVRGEATPPVALDDAVTALEVIEAAMRSPREGGVVTLR